jgi:hypothetical protein
MPRSRSRKGHKPYRPRELSPALAAKADRDYRDEPRKFGMPIIGGQGSRDASLSAREGKELIIPADPGQLSRKARLYGLKKGLLEYNESGKLIKVRAR